MKSLVEIAKLANAAKTRGRGLQKLVQLAMADYALLEQMSLKIAGDKTGREAQKMFPKVEVLIKQLAKYEQVLGKEQDELGRIQKGLQSSYKTAATEVKKR